MKVLIAEDDPISRHLLERLLVQWSYDVVATTDGVEAWYLLQQPDAPRLAILDWMMPDMDGIEICREVRRQIIEPYTYLLLLTAKTQKQDLIEGMQAGADDYITKPFDPDELRVRLRAGRRILELQEHLIAAREAARFPSTHDALTGLWNREAILTVLRRELARERGRHGTVGVVLANLDHFRDFNTVYGRLAGDLALREVSRRLRGAVSIFDTLGRYAGAEFLVVIPDCTPEAARQRAERVCSCIGDTSIDTLGGGVSVSLTVGVATSDPASDADTLLRAAEEAVRRGKKAGGNRIEATLALAAHG